MTMSSAHSQTLYSSSPESFDCKQGAIRAARLNVDGNYCITCGADKSIKLWNPYRQLLLKTYAGHGFEVLDARGSFDSSQIASGSADKTVMLWDVGSGKALRKLRGHMGKVNCVCFNEESTVVLSGSLDCTVKVWDLKSQKQEPVQTLDEAKDQVMSIVATNYEILTGSLDGRIRRYDLRAGKLHQDYIGKSVTSVCFTNDSQGILLGTMESAVMLMDKDNGEMLGEYVGHKSADYRCDAGLNAKDTHVLSGSEDGQVYCWDLITGQIVQKLDHGLGETVITCVAHHPKDGSFISTAKNKLFIWKAVDT
ncbi:WD repeat domain-containing protein 83-like [Paramacrobiotus metropolitanus]|uniref:WD repeat domain-containing protein 83-like n=1 Tax=Paramacrobiotus metropolitanus TaxID=2943436 RepID=UPI002446044D|nr:WD repeat domain-containing protein 83-like [Paramacrobiotus metropolitanus]